MNSFIYQININFKRIILRNKRFFLFDMMLPIIFYLLYSKVLVNGIPQADLKTWQMNYLISMIIYSCLLGSIITVANTLLEDKTSHFDILSRLTPLPRWQYYLSRILIFMLLNLISAIVICLVGILVNHLTLPIANWSLIILISVLGTTPLIFMGILISLANNPATVNLLNNIVVFPLAIISGLWWPITMMPKWLQSIGKLTPTFEISNIDQSILHGTIINSHYILGIILWLMIIVVITLLITKYQKHKELIIE
ncbi:ABC transporter permease [Companilactobacillus huachuanensis]|uniref:ABC transporter permease n=1 Tax=Companilactobacillus huachuanensis TaxID=2559914 RepID=A0ABW1RQ32_9LACO|nr:ABC transporter permease [Companilactobacillus huachuanensis]